MVVKTIIASCIFILYFNFLKGYCKKVALCVLRGQRLKKSLGVIQHSLVNAPQSIQYPPAYDKIVLATIR
jgi:hypothetical protein